MSLADERFTYLVGDYYNVWLVVPWLQMSKHLDKQLLSPLWCGISSGDKWMLRCLFFLWPAVPPRGENERVHKQLVGSHFYVIMALGATER